METTKLTSGNTTTLILFYVWKNEARYFNQTKRKLKKNDLSQEKCWFLTIWWQSIFGCLCPTFVCQYCRRALEQTVSKTASSLLSGWKTVPLGKSSHLNKPDSAFALHNFNKQKTGTYMGKWYAERKTYIKNVFKMHGGLLYKQ